MKIRTGFVSNSSSSSYVCDVSGETIDVQDGCFWDVGLCQCKVGHIFKKEFLVKWERQYPTRQEMISFLEERIDSKRECAKLQTLSDAQLKARFLVVAEEDQGNRSNVNECPICTMTQIKNTDLLEFLLKISGQTREEVFSDIREKFGSYEEFKRFISKK